MKNILLIVSSFVFLVYAQKSNGPIKCKLDNETRYICTCDGAEDETESFEISTNSRRNTSHLEISSCNDVSLTFSALDDFKRLESMRLQNIKGTLEIEAMVYTTIFSSLEILNVTRIPRMETKFFDSVSGLKILTIENTVIESLEENFGGRKFGKVSFKNVTFKSIASLEIANGISVNIDNCRFQKVTETIAFKRFESINVCNSFFDLTNQKGLLSIKGDIVTMENNVFLNAKVKVNGLILARVARTCADGSSELIIESREIVTIENELPTQIVILPDYTLLRQTNNKVCNNGNCKCIERAAINSEEIMFAWPCHVVMLLTMLISKF